MKAYKQILTIRSGQASFVRIWRGFLAARFALAMALASVYAIYWLVGKDDRIVVGVVASVYLVVTAVAWGVLTGALDKQRSSFVAAALWAATVGVDVLLFAAVYLLSPVGLTYLSLFVLPALMAGTLGTRLFALFVASSMSLLLLTDASLGLLRDGGMALGLAQAALLASALFAVALIANELALRLERQEVVARDSQLAARRQGELSRLVIEKMQHGVVVVDDGGVVQAMNPAARALFGDNALRPPFLLAGRSSTSGFVPLLDRLTTQGAPTGNSPTSAPGGEDLIITHPERGSVKLLVRSHRTGPAAGAGHATAGSGVNVLFLEDFRETEARVQQEKLAAMGRITAGVAHEIRNPLAAISHAAALLEEELASAGQQRLLALILQNTGRLDRLVDDILEVARAQPASSVIALAESVGRAVSEWVPTHRLTGHEMSVDVSSLSELEAEQVWFDADHLRRVIVNLLDNAALHGQAGTVQLSAALREGGGVDLRLVSPGPALSPDVQARLFEPFFSTRSQGSGLGLHLCSEICARHGASLRYERDGAGNAFVIGFRRVAPKDAPA